MLDHTEQFFIVYYLARKLNSQIDANIQTLARDDRFDDLQGVRRLLEDLLLLHARAEDTKAFHFSAEDAREALGHLRDDFRSACAARFENTALYDKIFG